MSRGINDDILAKMVVIGDSTVGKTQLVGGVVNDRFVFNSDLRPTVGIEFATKTVLHNGQWIKLQIWDIARQEQFRSIVSAYCRGAVIAVIAYDITNRESFEHAKGKWLDEIRKHTPPLSLKLF